MNQSSTAFARNEPACLEPLEEQLGMSPELICIWFLGAYGGAGY